MIRARWCAVLALVGATGCGTALEQPTLVSGPRVLAIVAESPEARPGESVSLRVITGGFAHPPAVRWSVCTRPEETTTVLPLSSFGQFDVDRGCESDGAVGVTPAGDGPSITYVLPADVTRRLDLLRGAYGALPDATLEQLGATLGVPMIFTAVLTEGDTRLRAFKRVAVFTDATRAPNANPPPPSFTFAGRAFGPSASERDLCVALDGVPVTIARGDRVQLVPAAGEEAWLETYVSQDTMGNPVERHEEPFYSPHSTAGVWDLGRSRQPDREPHWTAPQASATVRHWFVVRDGRGGTSACSFETTTP